MGYNLEVSGGPTMDSKTQNPYDQILYRTQPSHLTHPEHLAALSILFGMSPAPAENCRVLEVGCGDGANLIPMALTLPGSRFAGVDLAAVPLAAARAMADKLHLSNLALHQLDIMELDPTFGEFDYIIAHGVYSWVPPPVRDKLLGVCRANLAPHGVAFVSYNTFPGGHLRKMMREMLAYQTKDVADPQLRLKHAYALVNFLHASNPKSAALREEVEAIRSSNPSLVFHDDLEPVNDPVYFHEFMEHARQHGLQFLAETEFFLLQNAGYPAEVLNTVRLLAGEDRIREQQYLDFLRCRRFRQTLLCRQEVPLKSSPDPRRATRLYVSCPAKPVRDGLDLHPGVEEEFRTREGASMKTDLPLAKAVVLQLAKCWPLAVPFDELLSAVRAMPELAAAGAVDAPALAELLLKICAPGMVELLSSRSKFTLSVSERPRAFSLARLQAEEGTMVTTMRHSTFEIQNDLTRRLLLLLDGSRNHDQIQRELGVASSDLERNLGELARLGLLEA